MNKKTVAHAFNICAVLGVAMLTTNASAQTLSEAISECGRVENSLKRLVCYDQLVKEMQQYSGLDEAVSKGIVARPVPVQPQGQAAQTNPQPQSSAPAAVITRPEGTGADSANPEDAFGKQVVRPDSQIERLYYDVTEVVKNRNNRATITMANGHKWRQTDSGTFRIKEGERVYVERGALGSFFLSKDDVNRRIRVVRIN